MSRRSSPRLRDIGGAPENNKPSARYENVSAAILNTSAYVDRMIKSIGDKGLAKKATIVQRASIKGCPKRSSPAILDASSLVVDSSLLDDIHRASAAHLTFEDYLYQEADNCFHSLDGSALLALGFLCEEAIREDLSEYLEIDFKSIGFTQPADSFYPYESILRRITARSFSNSSSGLAPSDLLPQPSLSRLSIRDSNPRRLKSTQRASFPETPVVLHNSLRPVSRSNVASNTNTNTYANQESVNHKTIDPALALGDPSPLVTYLKKHFVAQKNGNLDDIPDFDSESGSSEYLRPHSLQSSSSKSVLRKRWPRNVFM